MFIKQISVFVENKKGRLAKLTTALGDAGIDLVALSIADTTNYGILRLIAKDIDKSLQLIRDAGFTANTTEVLAVAVADKPGGLAHVLNLLLQHDISVEYLYSFAHSPDKSALVIFKVDDNENAAAMLEKAGIQTLLHADLLAL
ncbi:ACT domain-containing protein [Clostridia bacterium OttesenSCG-928-F22]|nr:ACT domain-containing protein [Clostridia bacterium OttesenSCG-928-F22]